MAIQRVSPMLAPPLATREADISLPPLTGLLQVRQH